MTILIFVYSRPEEGDSQWGHTQAGAAGLVLAAQTEDRGIHKTEWRQANTAILWTRDNTSWQRIVVESDNVYFQRKWYFVKQNKWIRSSVNYWCITADKIYWDSIRILVVMTGHVKAESGISLLSRLVTRPRVDTCLGPGLGPLTSPYTCLSVTGERRRL